MNILAGKKSAPYRYLLPTITLMIVFMVVPIFMVVTYSFADKAVISKNPSFVGLENYYKLFKDSNYWKSVYNTIIFVAVSVIAHMVIGMLFTILLN